MPDEIRAKFSFARELIETLILAGLVAVQAWSATSIIAQGKAQVRIESDVMHFDGRLSRVELGGSPQLQSHEKAQEEFVRNYERRLAKLEEMMQTLAPLATKVDTIIDGQKRFERLLEEHTKTEQKSAVK